MTTEIEEEQPSPGRVLLLGDSTVADLAAGRGIYGWGQFFRELFPTANIRNLAVSGASTKSFMALPQYREACEALADYWLIQFGHNDMKDQDPNRFTDPETTYAGNLRAMIAAARHQGAAPILVTSPHRLSFDDAGMLTEELLPYVNAMKAVAAEQGIAVIDLHALTGGVFQGLAKERALWITATEKGDFTHFTALGARFVGILVAQEFEKILRKA